MADTQEPGDRTPTVPVGTVPGRSASPEDGSTERDRRSAISAVDAFVLTNAPGHLFRRCQQRAVDLYTEEVGEDGPTPRQFAVMLTIDQNPGLSQVALVERTGIDRSTVADILTRLVRRGLVRRARLDNDQRVNALYLSDKGQASVAAAVPRVARAQRRILAPIPREDQAPFLRMLTLLAELPADGERSDDS